MPCFVHITFDLAEYFMVSGSVPGKHFKIYEQISGQNFPLNAALIAYVICPSNSQC